MSYIIIVLCFLLICCLSGFGDGSSSFNYEISAHTRTAISSLLNSISFAVDIPTDRFRFRKDMTIQQLTVPDIEIRYLVDDLYGLIKTYYDVADISSVYVAVESNGNFVGYIVDSSQQNNIVVGLTDPNNYYGESLVKNRMYLLNIDQYGYPLNLWQPGSSFSNQTYDPRFRPWYTPVKANPIKQWSPIYIDATLGEPCLTIVNPIFNLAEHGNRTFLGAMGLDLYLVGINKFLLEEYHGTDRIVFIIDKFTNTLIGNSLGIPNYGVDSNGKKVLVDALQSTSPTISGSVAMLIDFNWPSYLLIYDNKYLQNVVYHDEVQGVSWRIISLMPANEYVDAVIPGTYYYDFVLFLSCLGMIVNVVSIALLLYHWKSRIIALTQPLFTLIVLIGGMLLSILCFLLTGDNTHDFCFIRPYLFNLAFTLSVVPILIKSWTVTEAAKTNFSNLARGMLIPPIKLMGCTGAMLLIDLLILVVALYGVGGQDGKGTHPVTNIERANSGAYSQITRCAYRRNNGLVIAETIFKGIIITVSCVFAFLNRKIPGAIASSRELLIMIYNIALSASAVLVVQYSVKNIVAGIVAQALGICACITLNAVLLIGPSIYTLHSVGDSSALAYVESRLKSEADLAKIKGLPVHYAIVRNEPVDDILLKIETFPDSIIERVDGKSAFDLALERKADEQIMLELIRYLLPYTSEREPVSIDVHGFAWAMLSQHDEYVNVVRTILDENPQLCFVLANAQDDQGRVVLNISSPGCRDLISKATYFMQRYQLTTSYLSPHYQSLSTVVHLAIDHGSDVKPSVALKFLRNSGDFQRHRTCRDRCNLDVQYFISTITDYDASADALTSSAFAKHGFSEYKYCIVMPAGNRNLAEVLVSEVNDSVDFVKFLGYRLIKGLQHLHSMGFIHGDVKPQNIIRLRGDWVMIDLDSSAPVEVGYSGIKLRSAYAPPELIFELNGKPAVRVVGIDSDGAVGDIDMTYDLVPAKSSHDCWALGVVFFRIITGEPLFLANAADDIDSTQLKQIGTHDYDWLNSKLQKIVDPLARSLVSQMLSFDPLRRPCMEQLLMHPFFTGRSVARMVGEPAEFDVFISYRVASDAAHASLLYDLLTERGLKVWWDKKCLVAGENWETGFCEGLIKSLIFVAILSTGAVNHPSRSNQNFSRLRHDSPCDNVLLEHRLALDLLRRGLLSFICPILIGEFDEESKIYGKFSSPDLSVVQNVVVESVEMKLREHLNRQSLSSSMLQDMSVSGTMEVLKTHEGYLVQGNRDESFGRFSGLILDLVNSARIAPSKRLLPGPRCNLSAPKHPDRLALHEDRTESSKSISLALDGGEYKDIEHKEVRLKDVCVPQNSSGHGGLLSSLSRKSSPKSDSALSTASTINSLTDDDDDDDLEWKF